MGSNPIPLIAVKQERPMMWYIFEKEIVQGPQKQCSQVKNKNLENLENLENQENLKNLENLENLENQENQENLENNFPKCVTSKYKYTNTIWVIFYFLELNFVNFLAP